MNERIKELAVKCGAWNQVYNPHSFMVDRTFDVEKFAELIVGECAGIVADAVDHREPASTYRDKIKQHFGVK